MQSFHSYECGFDPYGNLNYRYDIRFYVIALLFLLFDIEIVYFASYPGKRDFDFWISLDCLLVPSRGDNSPNVIHEAKQFGLPIIATDVGGITEMLFLDIDTLIYISNLSAESILSAINIVKEKEFDVKTIQRMQNAYLEYVGEPLKKIIEIYLELLTSKSSTL